VECCKTSLLIPIHNDLLSDNLQQFVGVFCFLVWYYPVGLYQNSEWTDAVNIRGFHAFILVITSFLFASTFAHVIIAGSPNEEIAGSISTLLGIMLYAFCGILSGPDTLPGFWIFMYRANPFTYLVSSFMATTLGQAPAYCTNEELQVFAAPPNTTCGEYLQEYIERTGGGYVTDPQSVGECRFCQIDSTDQYLKTINVDWDTRWRDFGLLWVYIVFNVGAVFAVYYIARVPKGKKEKRT
jgi:ATP-binding cassette, subfamily G (WHITE), member 2, PDR